MRPGRKFAGTIDQFMANFARHVTAWAEFQRGEKQIPVEAITIDVPCGTCNKCCRGGYEVEIHPNDWKGLKTTVSKKDRACKILKQNPDGSCVYLKEGKCSIREHRPASCRAFDCRQLFFAGIRFRTNTSALGNEVIEQWYTRSNEKSIGDDLGFLLLRNMAMDKVRHDYPEITTAEMQAAAILALILRAGKTAAQVFSMFVPPKEFESLRKAYKQTMGYRHRKTPSSEPGTTG